MIKSVSCCVQPVSILFPFLSSEARRLPVVEIPSKISISATVIPTLLFLFVPSSSYMFDMYRTPGWCWQQDESKWKWIQEIILGHILRKAAFSWRLQPIPNTYEPTVLIGCFIAFPFFCSICAAANFNSVSYLGPWWTKGWGYER